MTRPAAPDRTARGLLVAVVGLGVALAGHSAAGGLGVASPLAALAAGAVAVGCVLASREVWTARRLVAALVAMQVAVHGSMWLAGPARAVDPRLAAYAGPGSTHAHAGAGDLPVGMVLAHLAAIVVAAALLAGLDAALAMVRALARVVALLWSGSPGSDRVVRIPLPAAPHGPRAGVLRRPTLSHRGPPAIPASC